MIQQQGWMISTALIWRQCNGVLWWPTQEMVWWALKLFEKNSTDISIQNSVIYFFSDICFHSLYFCFESDAFFRWILCQGGGVGSLWQWWRLERQRLKAWKKLSKLNLQAMRMHTYRDKLLHAWVFVVWTGWPASIRWVWQHTGCTWGLLEDRLGQPTTNLDKVSKHGRCKYRLLTKIDLGLISIRRCPHLEKGPRLWHAAASPDPSQVNFLTRF